MSIFSRIRNRIEKTIERGFKQVQKVFSRETQPEKKETQKETFENIQDNIEQKIQQAIEKAQRENSRQIEKLQREIATLKEEKSVLRSNAGDVARQFHIPENETIPEDIHQKMNIVEIKETPFHYRFHLEIENLNGEREEIYRTVRSSRPLSQQEAQRELERMYDVEEGGFYSSENIVPGSVTFQGALTA